MERAEAGILSRPATEIGKCLTTRLGERSEEVGPESVAEATTETERKMVAPWKSRGEDDAGRQRLDFCCASCAARENIERESAMRPPHLRLLVSPSSSFRAEYIFPHLECK
jgi:hypothetical protein